MSNDLPAPRPLRLRHYVHDMAALLLLGAKLEGIAPAELLHDVVRRAIELAGGVDVMLERPHSAEAKLVRQLRSIILDEVSAGGEPEGS